MDKTLNYDQLEGNPLHKYDISQYYDGFLQIKVFLNKFGEDKKIY